jgi:hypothetical protein
MFIDLFSLDTVLNIFLNLFKLIRFGIEDAEYEEEEEDEVLLEY